MLVKKRNRWALKNKNRIGQRSTVQRCRCCCVPPSIIKNEPVALKEDPGGDIFKKTSYGKLFQATLLLLEDYCANSTLHGVRFFVDKKRHWLERLWWIAGFVTSIFCCGALIHKVYDNWDQRSIIVSISEELTPVWDIPLPAITICPANKIQSTQFDLETFFRNLFRNLDENPEMLLNMTDEEEKILLAYSVICFPALDLVNISDKFSANSVIDFVWQLAPSLNYTINDCMLLGYVIGIGFHQCELAEIMTEMGLCFTFNMLNGKETYSIESAHYSQMDHNKTAQWNLENGYDPNISINSDAYPYRGSGSVDADELTIFMHLSREHYVSCGQAAFQIALHLPGEIPQRYQFKLLLASFEGAAVTLKPKAITTSEGLRSYHPYRRKCYFNADRKLRFLNIYTQGNCEVECLSNFTLSLCGCVPHFLLRDANTPICGFAKYECSYSARMNLVNGQIKRGLNYTKEEYARLNKLVENCNCLPACNSIKYDAEIRRFDFNKSKNDIDQVSVLNLAFEESKFITLTRSEIYGTIDFIANCGGLLGLFVGASFLSVVELLYYCSLRLYCTRRNQKRKNNRAISTVT